MHEKVKYYLEKNQTQEKERTEKKKNELLISLGLYEKVYPEKGERINYNIYNCSEYINGECVYFKKVAIDVSDEELDEILKYANKDTVEQFEEKKSNAVSTTLKVFAWLIFIGGFIIGCVNANVETGYYYTYTKFSIAIAMIYWVASLFSGVCLLGFAKIIDLLQEIKNKIK